MPGIDFAPNIYGLHGTQELSNRPNTPTEMKIMHVAPRTGEISMHDTVMLKCTLGGLSINAMVDSGAGCSVISSDILNKIRKANTVKTDKVLVDASGNDMNIIGVIMLPVKIIGLKESKLVEFFVSDANSSCFLLGRNFMKLYGTITFNFRNSRVKLGNYRCNEVEMKQKQHIAIKKQDHYTSTF